VIGHSSSHFGWSGRFGVHPLGCSRPRMISSHSSHPSHNEHCWIGQYGGCAGEPFLPMVPSGCFKPYDYITDTRPAREWEPRFRRGPGGALHCGASQSRARAKISGATACKQQVVFALHHPLLHATSCRAAAPPRCASSSHTIVCPPPVQPPLIPPLCAVVRRRG